MKRPIARRHILSLALAAALAGPVSAQTIEAFTVSDIRVEGLQRISAGTVYSYLPVEKGEAMSQSQSAAVIRALYKTGFFTDVKLERQGDILVITVKERPAINTVKLVGNKDIKSEELEKGLKNVGISEGETYNPVNLDRVTQELNRQYNNRGKYNATVVPEVAELDRNRVDITLRITEGKATKIRDINLVGNEKFTDAELRESWESGTSNWLSWYRRDDQYSREKLSGDLEKLSNFYLDRGYADFNIESTQVAISPDRKDIFLSANMTEGDIYKVSSVKITGDTVLPVEELNKLLLVKEGDTFSRARLEYTSDSITSTLGNIGYAFAKVNPVPDINREAKTIGLNFVVDPGPRVQVRRIRYSGNVRTSDEVLRREMRQFEGAWYSQAALDRSKIRLQRLGYFESVDVETPEVAGRPDQVDVVISVKERNSGSFVFGLGYQGYYGVTTNAQINENNFLGTGNRLGLTVQNSSISKRLSLNYFDPYFTDDGISVGYNLNFSDNTQADSNSDNSFTRFNGKIASGEAIFGVPITETDTVQFALGIDRNQITTSDGSTPFTLINYLVNTLGDRERGPSFSYHVDDDNNTATPSENDDADPLTTDTLTTSNGGLRLWNINAWRMRASWSRDSRNDYLLPTRGTYHRLGAEIVLPGSDLEYYKLQYTFEHFMPLASWVVLKVSTDIGYGDSYGKTNKFQCSDFDRIGLEIAGTQRTCGLPFFQHYYAGGPNSVRGFEQNSLGPALVQTNFSQPLGGGLKTTGSVEFLFPKLFSKSRGTRLSAFLDFGNVYATPSDFDAGELRASTGIALQWQAPVGPISISYSLPLRSEDSDRVERLQFSFGQQF
ncbi:MAG: outer membrane protein assembly factor BamA [Arenimonas sp.]